MPTASSKERSRGLSGVMRPVNSVVERFIPSALVFAIVLTFVVAILALVLTDTGPADVTRGWGEGLSGLLEFMTQMALILLLGHTLANTGPVRRLLASLGGLPRTALQGYLFVFVVAAVASLITWGLGLVVGVLLAVEVARQGREKGLDLHFPLLVAAGYSGYVIWHMGYSGSGTLTAATEGSFIAEQLGETVPISETTFAWWNLVAIVVTILAVGIGLALVAPRAGDRVVETEGRRPLRRRRRGRRRGRHPGRPGGRQPGPHAAGRARPRRLPGDPLLRGRHGDARHRQLDLPGPDLPAGPQPARADRTGQERRVQRRRDPAAVPALRRDHGDHGHVGPDHRLLRLHRRHRRPVDLRGPRLPVRRGRELLRAVRRRAVRRAGPGDARRRGAGWASTRR